MHGKDQGLIKKNSGGDTMPVEKRVIDTVKWIIQKYEIDSNRVYVSGNSMGGSGTLGIGMRHGDVFAAIKANVPAGIEHVSHRMSFPPQSVPENVKLPEPPVAIDYSAQNDGWSEGHDRFVKAMNDRKYSLVLDWGPFGHANNSAQIMKVNDLIDSFDLTDKERLVQEIRGEQGVDVAPLAGLIRLQRRGESPRSAIGFREMSRHGVMSYSYGPCAASNGP